MNQPYPIEYLVIPLVFLFIMFVIYLTVSERDKVYAYLKARAEKGQ